MLIWRADRFGLASAATSCAAGRAAAAARLPAAADRAGRADRPATLKRLRTMEALDQLGAGFAISARDLDLRGAGELLGENRPGT
jgi:transcription-repair coupling factor (superfamily II helicase)